MRYVYAAQALNMHTDVLVNMDEPDRTFWLRRGLMLNRAQAEAFAEDQLDRQVDAWSKRGAGGSLGM